MGSMDDVVFMDQVKRSERGLAESFWLAMAGGVPVPPGVGEEESCEGLTDEEGGCTRIRLTGEGEIRPIWEELEDTIKCPHTGVAGSW